MPRNSRPHREDRRRRARKLATVDVGGVRRQVNIACIVNDEHPVESCVGDWVLVHVGFAMSRIDEAEAARDAANPDRTRRGAGRDSRRCGCRPPNKEARSCPTTAICKALYPFLHGSAQDAGDSSTPRCCIRSKKRRADSRETNARFFADAGAGPGRRGQGARRRLSRRRPAVHDGQWRLELRRRAYRGRIRASGHRRPPGARRDQSRRRSRDDLGGRQRSSASSMSSSARSSRKARAGDG